MSDFDDDAVDNLLLEQFEGPVPDDGFCVSVMQILPARRRRSAWPLALGIAAGGAACWLSMLSTPLLRIGWQDWSKGELSAPALILFAVMTGISILAMAWTAGEADDR